MFVDETSINAQRRDIYVMRIRRAIERIGVIDGCDAMELSTDLVESFDFALRHHLAEWSRVELRPLMGLGTDEWFRVRGRVAEKSKVQMPQPDEEPFDILVSCWYRFLISKMPPTPILARRGSHEVLTATDEEGFFDLMIGAQYNLSKFSGYSVELEVGDQATVRAEKEIADILVPPPDTEHAILVDLDGILLERPRSPFTQVLGEIVLGNLYRHVAPLEGVDTLVKELYIGPEEKDRIPIFYISNAPRHLSNHISAAIEYASLPDGFLQLRDFDLRLRKLTSEKTEVLEMLLAHEIIDCYPNLDFIFVGTTSRLDDYATMLKAIGHRLKVVLLFGEEHEVKGRLTEIRENFEIDICASDGAGLLEFAIEHGWADEE